MAKDKPTPSPVPMPHKEAPKLPPETAAKPVEKPEPVAVAGAKHVCVLTVKENTGVYQAGAAYEGEGLKDPARLAHLLKRGAIRAA